jgi:hypothetical protein
MWPHDETVWVWEQQLRIVDEMHDQHGHALGEL